MPQSEAHDSFSAFSEQSTAILKTYTRKIQPKRRLLPGQKLMFPFYAICELDVDWKYTLLGVIIETVELAGLLINNNYPWGTGVKSSVDKVFYSFLLPFFDEDWIGSTKVVWYVLLILIVLFIACIICMIIYFVMSSSQSMPDFMAWTTKHFLHLLPGVLIVPIYSLFAATGACEPGYSKVFWSDANCFTGSGGAYHMTSYIIMIAIGVLVYMSVGFCFDDMPDTANLAARPRCIYHSLSVICRAMLAIMFHILIALDQALAYAIVFASMSALMLGMHVVILPYYDMFMNRLRGVQWGTMVGVSIATIVTKAALDSETDKCYSLVFLIVFALLGGAIGYFLPLLRVNSVFSDTLSALKDCTTSDRRHPEFPANLPLHDLALSKYPRIEKLLLGASIGKDVAVNDSTQLNEIDPYLSAVYFPSDVEASTRFLREYSKVAPEACPTKLMNLFAGRIFTKGMVKFPDCPQIQCSFCVFLILYAKRLRMSLTELTLLSRDAPYLSIPLQYRLHRLNDNLKVSLNLLNSRNVHLSSISNELHREIIGAMSSFWGCLAGGNPSTVALADIADYITTKRENCKSFYNSTLHAPSEELLLSYSTFLRDVMLDEEGARALRSRVVEEVESRQSRQNENQGYTSAKSQENWNSCLMVLKNAEQRHQMETKAEESNGFAHSRSVFRMRLFVYFAFGLLFFLAVGMLSFMIYRMSKLNKTVNQIEHATNRAVYYTFGVFLTNQLAYYFTDTLAADYVATVQEQLQSTAVSLYYYHYKLTLGSYKTNYNDVHRFTSDARVPISEVGTLSMEGDFDTQLGELFDAGFSSASAFSNLANTPTTSSLPTNDLRYVTLNFEEFTNAFNASSKTYVEYRKHTIQTLRWGIIVMCCFSAFVLMCVFTLLLLFIHGIEMSKESIINLFLVIPKSYVKALHHESWQKVQAHINESKRVIDDTVDEDDVEEEAKSEKQDSQKPASPVADAQGIPPAPLTSEEEGGAERQGNPNSSQSFIGASLARSNLSVTKSMFVIDDDDETTDAAIAAMMQEKNARSENDTEFLSKLTERVNNFFLDPIVVLVMAVLAVGLAAFSYGMIYTLYRSMLDANEYYASNYEFYDLMKNYFSYYSRTTLYAQQYAITGDLVHVQRYYYFTRNHSISSMLIAGAYDFTDLDTIQAVLNVQKVIRATKLRQTVSMYLASEKYGVGSNLYCFSRINAIEKEYDFEQLSSLLATLFSPYKPVVLTDISTTTAKDALLTDDEKLVLAKNLLFDDYYQDFRFLLVKYLNDFVASREDLSTHHFNRQKVFWYLSVVGLGLCFIVLLLLFREAVVMRRSFLMHCLIIVTLLTVAATIVFLAVSKGKISTVYDQSAFSQLFALTTNATGGDLMASQGYAIRIAMYGYESSTLLWNELFSSAVTSKISDSLYTKIKDESDSSAYSSATNISYIYSSIEHIMYYSNIAVDLSLNAYGLGSVSNLYGFSYNVELEANFLTTLLSVKVGNGYSDEAEDFAKTTAEQLLIAIGAVSGPRYDLVTQSYYSGIDAVYALLDSESETTKDNLKTFLFLSLVFGAVVLALVVFLLVNVEYRVFVGKTITQQRKSSSKHQVARTLRTRVSIILKLFLAIAILIAILVAIFIVFLCLNTIQYNESDQYLIIHTRLFVLSEVILRAQSIWYGAGNDQPISPYINSFWTMLDYSISYEELLYLGDGNHFSGILHRNSSADNVLFGSSTYEYLEYSIGCLGFELQEGYNLGDFTDAVTDGVPSTLLLERLFSYGSETVWFQYLVSLLAIRGGAAASVRSELMNPIITTLIPLLDSLSGTFASLYDTERDRVKTLEIILFVLIGLFILLTFVALFAVILPLLQHLLEEEEGTRLLIRMIPENIRRDVPMLHDFFENGSVNPDIQMVTDSCDSVDSAGLLVVSDHDGIIDATDEALRRFLYSKEQIVTLLLDDLFPTEIAEAMSDYREQMGTSRLKVMSGKTVRTAVKRSNGSVFPIDLYVREVLPTVTCPDTFYVLRLQNVDVESQIELARKIHQQISLYSQHPIVVLDASSKILSSNPACAALFGLEAIDYTSEHFSVLLDSSDDKGVFALKQFYDQARTSSESISTTFQVIGKGKNDTDVPLSMSVTSIVSDRELLYVVCHLMNLSNQFRVKQINAVTKAAIASSPVPVVMFNCAGYIVSFSAAAERSWGYKEDGVRHLRVNDLLHESDAERFKFTSGEGGDLRYFWGVTRALVAKRANGQRFVVETRMKEIRTEKGENNVICYFKDLSKEMDISHRNIISQSAFDISPIAIVVIDSVGEVKTVNHAFEKLFDCRAADVLDKNVKMFMPEHIALKHDEYLQRYRETGVRKILNKPVKEYAKRSDGRIFAIELHVVELEVNDVLSETGSRKLFAGYIRDMSEQCQMQRSNEMNDEITKHCPTPIISIDKAGIILSFNPAASQLFGYNQSAVVGRSVSLLMPDRYARNHDSYVQHAAKNMSTRVDSTRDVTALTANRVEIPVRIHVMELNKGVVDSIYVASVKDLSLKSRIQDECKLEQTFISMFPHGIIVANRRGAIQFVSDGATKSFGFSSADSAIGTNFLSLLHGGDFREREAVLTLIMDVTSPEFSKPRRVNCVRRSGVPFIASITAKVLNKSKVADTNMDAVVVLTVDDLTEQGVVAKSTAINAELLSKFNYGIAQLSEEGKVVFVNDRFLEELAFTSRGQAIGKSLGSLLGEAGTPVMQQINAYSVAGVMGSLFTEAMEFKLVRHNRSKVHVELYIRPVSEDAEVGFLVYLRNIGTIFSDRNDKKLISDIMASSVMPAVAVRYGWKRGSGLVNEDGTIYLCNEAAAGSLQYDPEELFGKHLQSILTPTGRGARSLTEQFYVASKGDQKNTASDKDDANSKNSLVAFTTFAIAMRQDRSTFPVRVSLMESFDLERNYACLYIFMEETTEMIKEQVSYGVGLATAAVCPLPIVCCNGLGEIVLFTEHAEALFGYAEAELLGKSIAMLVDPRNCGDWLTKISSADPSLRTGACHLPRVIARKKDDNYISVDINFYESPGGNSRERLFVSLIRDTTGDVADSLAGQLSTEAMMAFGIPFIVASPGGMIELVNNAFTELVQYSRDELLSNTFRVLFAADVSRKLAQFVNTVEDISRSSTMYSTIKRKDGMELPVQLTTGVFRSFGRTSLYAFVINLSETVSLKKEYAITEVMASLEGMVILYLSGDGSINDCTISAARFFNYIGSDNSLHGVHISTLFPNIGQFTELTRIDQNQQNGTDREGRPCKILEGVTRTGETLFCAVVAKELALDGTNVTYAMLLHDFVTAKDQRKSLVKKALSSIPTMAVMVNNIDNVLVYINEKGARIFGYRPEELVGKNVATLIANDGVSDHKRAIDDYLKTGADTFHSGQMLRVVGVRKDGSQLPLGLQLEDVTTPTGREFFSFITDLTHEVSQDDAEKVSNIVLSLLPTPVMLFSSSGKVLACSPLASTTIKLNRKKLIGTNIKNFIRASDNVLSSGNHLVTVIQTREDFLFQMVVTHSGVCICTIGHSPD